MLTTSGYFKSLICPFHKNGLCERPNCHFKHEGTDAAENLPTCWPSLDIIEESPPEKKPLDVITIDDTQLEVPTYNPTPKFTTNTSTVPVGILKIKKEPSIPEYRPTPISKLNQLSQIENPNYVDEIVFVQSVTGHKRKKIVDEYVPEEVRGPSRKRVSFNLPEDNESEGNHSNETITVESSDEDDDISATDGPKFSDDDDIENDEIIDTVVIPIKQEPVDKDNTLVSENTKSDISQCSIVDGILDDVSKSEEFIRSFKRPSTGTEVLNSNKVIAPLHVPESDCTAVIKTEPEGNSLLFDSLKSVVKIKEELAEKEITAKTSAKNVITSEQSKEICNKIEAKRSSKDEPIQFASTIKTNDTILNKSNIISTKCNSHISTNKEVSIKSDKKSSSKITNHPIKKNKYTSNDAPKKSSKHESKNETRQLSPNKNSSKTFGHNSKEKITEEKSSSKSHEQVKHAKKSDKSFSHHVSTADKNKGLDKKYHNDDILKTETKKNSSDFISSKNIKNNDSKSVSKTSDSKHNLKTVSKTEDLKSSSRSHDSKSVSKNHDLKTKNKDSKNEKIHSKLDTLNRCKSDKHSGKVNHEQSTSKTEKHEIQKGEKRKNEAMPRHTNKNVKKIKTDSHLTKKNTTKIQDREVSSSVAISKKCKLNESKLNPDFDELKSNKHTHSMLENEKNDSPFMSPSKLSHTHDHKIKSPTKSSKDMTSKFIGHQNYNTNSSDDDSNSNDDIDQENTFDSDSDDVDEECWRIFNELEKNAVPESLDATEELQQDSPPQSSKTLLSTGKKRVAHQLSFEREKTHTIAPAKRLNPAQVMHNRFKLMQETYAKQKESIPLSTAPKRIASVSNPDLINAVMQKNRLTLSSNNTPASDATSRVANSIKGGKRIAHVPAVATKPRPIIPHGYGNKVASSIRQKYLNTFIDECLKFCITEDEAYKLALEEEKTAYDRCSSKTVYLNVAANTISRLRHRAQEGPTASSTVSSTTSSDVCRKTVSHEAVLAGPRAQHISYSIEKKKFKPPEIEIKGSLLYSTLKKYILTDEQLVQNGFPLPDPAESGRAVVSGMYSNKRPQVSNDSSKRICSRCQKTYYVNEDGDYIKDEECDFHWGRLYKRRIAGQFEARYTCCSSDAESEGCSVGVGHVFDGFDSHLLKGFVKTLPKSPPPDKYWGVYSLDCEMCYTTAGIELTRITVINPEMKPIYDSFVKPEHRVLDYNTRFSGIKEEDLEGITTTIRDVQAIMLCMFNDKTILIGHSLESDLKALKLIHKTVVDTSVVFPHKIGLPYKRALKTLMAEKCNKIIQNSTEGHDSSEDALACMELMLWRLKEDAKSPR